MRFLGLGLADRVPDARTISLLREKLTRAGAIKGLFARFDAALRAAGYMPYPGRLWTPALWRRRSQRNTEAEKRAMKEGRVPEDWEGRARQAAAEGPRCPLDRQVLQGQAERGRVQAAAGSGNPDLRYRERLSR